jgi:hypothetical protein
MQLYTCVALIHLVEEQMGSGYFYSAILKSPKINILDFWKSKCMTAEEKVEERLKNVYHLGALVTFEDY